MKYSGIPGLHLTLNVRSASSNIGVCNSRNVYYSVITHLEEGKTLLGYTTEKHDDNDDLITIPTVPNAMALNQKLSTMSVEEVHQYKFDVIKHFAEVFTE